MPVRSGDSDSVWGAVPGDPDLTPPDPANLRTTSEGPPLSSEAPGDSTEPQPVTEVEIEQDQNATEPEPLPQFDPRFRKDLDGLMFLGYLQDEFDWGGHHFVINTLKVDELLEVGLVHARFVGTMAEVKAYQAAVAAACVAKVDGKPLPLPMSEDEKPIEARFNYIRSKWYPWTLDAIYERYLLLEQKVQAVIEAMGKAQGSMALTPG